MKITFLLTWGDAMGGTEKAAYTQAAHLAPLHEVEVLSIFKTESEPFLTEGKAVTMRYLVDRTGSVPRPVRASTLTDDECLALASQPSELIPPSAEPTFDRLSDFEMAAAISVLDCDILITTTPALMMAMVELAPPRVVTLHQEHRISQLRGPTGEPMLIHAPRLDALVSLTELTTNWFAESLGQSAPLLATIPNAMPEGYKPRSDLETKVVMVAARMMYEKGMDLAIQAFAEICEEHPGWVLRIFGGGPQLNQLRRLVEGLGLHDRVEILGRSRQMSEEWAKASIALMPSRWEAFGLVMLEAFAAGVPVVAFDSLTGPATIVRHEVDGLLVQSDDVSSYAAAMSRLMGDDDLRHAYGKNALEGARERFNAEKISAMWEDLFARLVERRDKPERFSERADRAARRIATGGSRTFAVAAPVSRLSPSNDEQKAREVIIQAQDRNRLIRSGGRVAEVRNDVSAWKMAAINLELAADALEQHGVPYIMLRDTAAIGFRLAVRAEDGQRVLDALADSLAGKPVYGELMSPRVSAPGAVLGERLRNVGEVKGVRVFKPIVSESRTLRYGPAYGCRVEFWSEDEDGWRVSPGAATVAGPRLPDLEATGTLTVGDRQYPSTTAFTGRDLMWDIDFPIDVVYTWVDDTDAAWRARRDAARSAAGLPDTGAEAGDVRFRNRDELRYSLRSLATHAPWVRKIFLVTDDQTPSWLNTEHPDIQVVSHREIFADTSLLPTFNSHAIESQLHRIEGLSEHFLYVNDDVFFGRPLTPGSFFHSNGTSKFYRSPTSIPISEITDDDEGYFVAAKNNRKLLKEAFGRTATHGFLHAPHPLRRSVLEQIAERWPEETGATAANRFRSRNDLSVTSSLHHHFGYLTGQTVPGAISCGYANIADYTHHKMLTRLLTSRHQDVFCIGESAESEVPVDEQDRVLRAFLSAYFPVPSPYER
nr:stealth conserved region 3 domain-containing protein [Streptomyces sp. NBC_00899]